MGHFGGLSEPSIQGQNPSVKGSPSQHLQKLHFNSQRAQGDSETTLLPILQVGKQTQ